MTVDATSNVALHLHDYTYGINSDPLAMFAMTFSALIHGELGLANFSLEIASVAACFLLLTFLLLRFMKRKQMSIIEEYQICNWLWKPQKWPPNTITKAQQSKTR